MHGDGLSVAKTSDGSVLDIATLSKLKREGLSRPKAFCLTCDRELIPRLGQINRHHFGHAPSLDGEVCWASKPEGEVHLAAKRKMAMLLELWCSEGHRIWVKRPCHNCSQFKSAGPETKSRLIDLSSDYKVVVEGWGDPTRSIKPDVQVVDSNGSPVLFVEIRVSHANTSEKLQTVERLGVPMVEIDGRSALEGVSEIPVLPFLDLRNVNEPGCCNACRVRLAEKERHEAFRKQQCELKEKVKEYLRSKKKAALVEASRKVPFVASGDWIRFGRCYLNFCIEDRTIAKTALNLYAKVSRGQTKLMLTHSEVVVLFHVEKAEAIWKRRGLSELPWEPYRRNTGRDPVEIPQREPWCQTKEAASIFALDVAEGGCNAAISELKRVARQWSKDLANSLHGADILTFGGFLPLNSALRVKSYQRTEGEDGAWATKYLRKSVIRELGGKGPVSLLDESIDLLDSMTMDRWIADNAEPLQIPLPARSKDNRKQFLGAVRSSLARMVENEVGSFRLGYLERKRWLSTAQEVILQATRV